MACNLNAIADHEGRRYTDAVAVDGPIYSNIFLWSPTYVLQRTHFVQIWVSPTTEVEAPFPDWVDRVWTLQGLSVHPVTLQAIFPCLQRLCCSSSSLHLHSHHYTIFFLKTVPSLCPIVNWIIFLRDTDFVSSQNFMVKLSIYKDLRFDKRAFTMIF